MKIGDRIELKENKKTILSKEEENGYKDQYFEEEDIDWVVLDINNNTGKVILISAKPTKQKITFKGMVGYENCIQVLDKLCKYISGNDNARSLREEDLKEIKYWESEEKQNLIFGDENNEFDQWLATQYQSFYKRRSYLGIRLASPSGYNVGNVCLVGSSGGLGNSTYSTTYGVRPIICISKDKLIGKEEKDEA